jgi:hypothetical protein
MTPSSGRLIDVCNGDADGLCALLQWRLAHPANAETVTGLKREHDLLSRVSAVAGDEVTVIDMAFEPHRAQVLRLLEAGVRVRYVDHHLCEPVPAHPLLEAHLNADSHICSGLLINQLLGGRFARWAVVCAHGDNLHASAEGLGRRIGLNIEQQQRLRRLGEAINHNACGDALEDVLVPPCDLLRQLMDQPDPLAPLPIAEALLQRLDADMARGESLQPARSGPGAALWQLPDAAWARRASGSLANRWANQHPDLACAVMRPTAGGCWLVSVRAPRSQPFGAADLCRSFGGGGRHAAAGIDALPDADRSAFEQAFFGHRWAQQPPQR